MKKHYSSVFNNESKLLKAIYEIHNNGEVIEADPMYNKGAFYKETKKPKFRFDINPRETIDGEKVEKADFTKDFIGMFKRNSWKSMILDPPFMFRKMNKSKSLMKENYTMYESYIELEDNYNEIIKTANYMLKKNGLLIFKCQDFTNSKTTFTSAKVIGWLEQNGFYVKDLALLDKKWKISNPNTTQRHFRKTHTYFFIAIKKKEIFKTPNEFSKESWVKELYENSKKSKINPYGFEGSLEYFCEYNYSDLLDRDS